MKTEAETGPVHLQTRKLEDSLGTDSPVSSTMSLLIRTPLTGFRVHPNAGWPHLNLKWPHFPVRSHSQELRFRTSTHICVLSMGGYNSTHNKYHIINECRKIIWKTQHPLVIKILSQLEMKATFLSLMKDNCRKPLANTILNGERLNTFSLKLGSKARMATLAISIHHHTGSPNQWNAWMNEGVNKD